MGTSHCLHDATCTLWWLALIGPFLGLYAVYCYVSAATPFSVWDMFIFYYQLYGYVAYRQHKSAIFTAWLSLNFDIILMGNESSPGLAMCLLPGMDQISLMCCSYIMAAMVLVFIILLYAVDARRLLPSHWKVNVRDGGRKHRPGKEGLGLAVVKGFTGIYNTLIGTTVQLVRCVQIPGISRRRLFIEADFECYTGWQIAMTPVLPMLLLVMVLPICLAMGCCGLPDRSYVASDDCGVGNQPHQRDAGKLPRLTIVTRCILRLRAVAQESGIFKQERWWSPQAFALSRALFAVVPAVSASSAQRAILNAFLLAGLMICYFMLMPFNQHKMHVTQVALIMMLECVAFYQVGDAYLQTTATTRSVAPMVGLEHQQNWFQVLALVLPVLSLILLIGCSKKDGNHAPSVEDSWYRLENLQKWSSGKDVKDWSHSELESESRGSDGSDQD